MTDNLEMVIDTMRITTRDNEGVVIESLGVDEGVLRIRYYEGTNDECPECVMSPESFGEMVRRMCEVQAPHVADVEIFSAR